MVNHAESLKDNLDEHPGMQVVEFFTDQKMVDAEKWLNTYMTKHGKPTMEKP